MIPAFIIGWCLGYSEARRRHGPSVSYVRGFMAGIRYR